MASFIEEAARTKRMAYRAEIDRWKDTDDFYLGRGGVFTGSRYLRKKGDIVVPGQIFKAHMIVLGATRSGKTVLFNSMISQAIRKGMGVMVLDFKPDFGLYQTSYYEAYKTGRLDDLVFFSPNLASARATGGVFPSSSATYNPMMSGSQAEITSRILRSISDFDKSSGNDKFWKDIEEDLIDAGVGCLMGMDRPWNYRDLWTVCTSMDAIRFVLENTKNKQARAKLLEVYQFFAKNPDTAKKYYKGTQVSLSSYALTEESPYINSYKPAIDLEEIVRKKKILHVALSPQLAEKTASGIAKLLISDLNSIVGRVLTTSGSLQTRFLVLVDEFENAVFSGINDLFNKSAGAGVSMVVGHQSFSDVDFRAGTEMRNIIVDNTQTKVFMLQTGVTGPKFMEEIAGKTFRNNSQYRRYSLFDPFVFFERDLRKQEMPLIEPTYLTNLEPLNFFAKIGDRVWRGVLPIVPSAGDLAGDLGFGYNYEMAKEELTAGLNLFDKFYDEVDLDAPPPPKKKFGRK